MEFGSYGVGGEEERKENNRGLMMGRCEYHAAWCGGVFTIPAEIAQGVDRAWLAWEIR